VNSVVSGAPHDIRGGTQLASLADAMTTRTDAQPRTEREALVALLGEAATERAISICATYQMMNRLLDAVGAPVHPHFLPIAEELGFHSDDLER